jgi:hypothetical protein
MWAIAYVPHGTDAIWWATLDALRTYFMENQWECSLVGLT